MKVGVFHPALDWYGGAEVVAVATANSLIQQGHDVVLFINNWVDQNRIKAMIGEPLSSSIDVIVKPTSLLPRGDFHLYESIIKSYILKLHCEILVDTYNCCIFPWSDVIYIHFPYPNNYEFNPKFPYLKKAAFRDIVNMPYVILEKNLANYDKKLLLANSYFTAKATEDAWGVTPKVLYPPIPSAMFEKNNISPESRDNLVVTLARFGQGKEVELIPQIAALTDKNIRYVMIGLAHDPKVIQDLKSKIRQLKLDDRVTILANASRQEIKSYLAKAKVYLHTKRNEHFGISIAEAMAMGCLPVVHNSGGAPEFVPDEYRYNELHEAAKIVEGAIQIWNSDRAREVIEIATQFSETNFSARFAKLFTDYCESQGKHLRSKF